MSTSLVENAALPRVADLDIIKNKRFVFSAVNEIREIVPCVGVWIVRPEPEAMFVRRSLLEDAVQSLLNWESKEGLPDVFRLLLHVPQIRDIDLDLIRFSENRIKFLRVSNAKNINDFIPGVFKALSGAMNTCTHIHEIDTYSRHIYSTPVNNRLAKRPCLEQLAIRMLWEEKIDTLIASINDTNLPLLNRKFFYLLRKTRFTPRDAFESFLLNSVAHESEPLAAEQSWVPTATMAGSPFKPFFGFQDVENYRGINKIKDNQLYNCAEKHPIIDFTEKHILGKTTRATKLAVYDACEEIVTNAVILRDIESKKLIAPLKLGINIKQRKEFREIFNPSNIRRQDFPYMLRVRIEDFIQGKCGATEFGGAWQLRCASENANASDRRVFFVIAFLNFICPELRRVPPYFSYDEAEALADLVAIKFEECMKFVGLYLCDMPFSKDEMYLSMGEFIKSVFQFRGRREMVGLWQRFRSDKIGQHYKTKAIVKFKPFLKKNITECLRIDPDPISTDKQFELFKKYTIDFNWFKREVDSDYLDGPFYVCGIFAAPVNDYLVEYATAIMLKICTEKRTDFIFGIGKRGTFCASLVSFFTGIPLSSLTIRPKFDISPRAYRKKIARSAFVIDDCIKTGYTNFHILHWLRSPSEPSCQSIKKIDWFNFCRVDPYVSDSVPPPVIKKFVDQLNDLRINSIFKQSNKKIIRGRQPYISADKVGQIVQNYQSDEPFITKKQLERIFGYYSKVYLDATDTIKNLEKKAGIDSLRKDVADVTASGIFRNYRTSPVEFKSKFLPLRFVQWLFADDTITSPVFLHNLLKKTRRNFWRVFWEEGAKYKPELLNRHPKLLVLMGVYFHQKLKSLDKKDRPNLLVANNRLSIPLTVSIALACRYDDGVDEKYEIALASDDGTRVSGLQAFIESNKELKIASITNTTTLNNFGDALAVTFKDKSKKCGTQMRVVATCCLFDVSYLNDAPEREKSVFGEFINFISLSPARPLNLDVTLKLFDKYFEQISDLDLLIKLALHFLTHNEGLKYNQALFLRKSNKGSFKVFQGIGPTEAKQANKIWPDVKELQQIAESAIVNKYLDSSSFWIASEMDGVIYYNCNETFIFCKPDEVKKSVGITRVNYGKESDFVKITDADKMLWDKMGNPEKVLYCNFSYTNEEWVIIVNNICLKEIPLIATDVFRVREFAIRLKFHLQRIAGAISK